MTPILLSNSHCNVTIQRFPTFVQSLFFYREFWLVNILMEVKVSNNRIQTGRLQQSH